MRSTARTGAAGSGAMGDYTYGATVERDGGEVLIDFPAFGGQAFAGGGTLDEAVRGASTVLRLTIASYVDDGDPLPDDDLEGADMVFTVEVSDAFINETRVVDFASEAEACDFADAAARDVIDGAW